MSKTIYCTYLTVYHGDKLPMYYIGSTSVEKIEYGYHGSVSSKKYKNIWITELKENPHLFETQILTTHSTREEALEEEIRLQELYEVVKSPTYINMAVANRKFIYTDYNDAEYRKKLSESHKGKRLSEESKKKISEAVKKRFESEDAKKKLSKSMTGKRLSEESKKKISEANKGKPRSEESKKKQSVAMIGRIKSEEHKKKLSEANTGKVLSEEHKKKLSETQKQRFRSEEARQKMSEVAKQRFRSEEARQKMSEAVKTSLSKKRVDLDKSAKIPCS